MKKMTGFNNRLLKATLAITFVIGSVASVQEQCIDDSCFLMPDPDVKLGFDGAKSWCAKQSSQLAVVTDSTTQRILTEFLSSSQLNQPAFINIRLYEHRWQTTWFLLNGSRYLGGLLNQDYNFPAYTFYGSLSNGSDGMELIAANPLQLNNYICEFRSSTLCSRYSGNNYMLNGGCFVKFDDEDVDWFHARESCYNKGGDLAAFNYPDYGSSYEYEYKPPFNTSWLNASSTYWIGIRWDKWIWKSPECGDEIIYTSWAPGRPNNTTVACVCVDPNASPKAFSWIDCDCDIQRQFVCLKIRPTSPSSTSSTKSDSQRPTDSVFIGLVIGTAMNLLLLIIILVLVIVIIRQRRRFRATSTTGYRYGGSARNGRVEATSELETDSADPRYVPLERNAGQGTITRRIYETLN